MLHSSNLSRAGAGADWVATVEFRGSPPFRPREEGKNWQSAVGFALRGPGKANVR